MKLVIGETVLLRNTHYHVQKLLGRGAITDVYLATMNEAPDTEVVIKLVRDDAGLDPLKVAGLRREAEALEILNQAEDDQWPSRSAGPKVRLQRAQEMSLERRIVALLDNGELEPGQPFVVQEKAPPAFERFDVDSLESERRMLGVAHAIADAITLAHRHELALKDFDPGTKRDRICVRWLDDPDRFELKIIDWNITGGPEDMAQDLFSFGRHLYYFLLGHHLILSTDNQPPANLSVVAPGWDGITEGSRQILQRLLHRDPRRRYQRATHLEADIRWWLDTLRQVDTPNVFTRLQERLWQVRPQGRSDRALAVAALAIDLKPPSETRQAFELWAQQARDELEKEKWQPIASARSTLLTGAYAKAADAFRQQVLTLPPESEPARLARVFSRLAQAGDLLKQAHEGGDVRSTPAWEALTRAVGALSNRRWEEAESAILETTRQQPEAAAWQPVNDLLDLTRAGLLLQEASDLSIQAAPRRADADRPDWLQVEADQIALLEQAVEKLQDAHKLAPREPDFEERLKTEQAHLKLRQSLLTHYQDGAEFVSQANRALQQGHQAEAGGDNSTAAEAFRRATEAFQAALGEFQTILEADSTQYRALLLRNRLEPSRREAEERLQATTQRAATIRDADQKWAAAQPLIREGAYSQALPHVRRAATLTPEREGVQETLAQVQASARLERQAQGYRETVRQYFQIRNLDDAQRIASQTLQWSGRPLSKLPGGDILSEIVGNQPFRLHDELSKAFRDSLDVIRHTEEAHDQISEDLSRGDHPAVIAHIDRLEEYLRRFGYELSDAEKRWRVKAKRRLKVLRAAEEIAHQSPSFEKIQISMRNLADDPNPKIGQLREKLGTEWRRRVEELTDLEEAQTRLREGMHLFQGVPVGQDLAPMRDLIEKALAIARAVNSARQSRPNWLHREGAKDNLSHLAKDLALLLSHESWPTLREQAQIWHRQLIEDLEKHRQSQMDAARQLSRRDEYPAALETTESFQNLVPETLRPPGWDELEHFATAIHARIQAQDNVRTLIAHLVAGERSFIEVAQQAERIEKALPDHPDVPTGDLHAIISDLKQAAAMEQAPRDTPKPSTYALLIYTRRRLAQERLEKLQGIPELQNQVEKLKNYLHTSIQQTSHQLLEALDKAIEKLTEQPCDPPDRLLILYWQARWWETTQGERLRGTANALGSARTILEAAAVTFKRMKATKDLNQAGQILNTLQRLNEGLIRILEDGDGQLLIDLPSLPQSRQYEELQAPLNPDALTGFESTIAHLQKLDKSSVGEVALKSEEPEVPHANETESAAETSPADADAAMVGTEPKPSPTELSSTAAYTPEQVDTVQTLAIQTQERLTHLRERIWPALELEPWTQDDSPAHLKRETEQHVALALSLTRAFNRLRNDGNAMAGLNLLYDEIEAQKRIETLDKCSLWLLAPQRRTLKRAFAALRRDLIAAIGDQVADILENNPSDTAQKKLKDEVLNIPSVLWVAEAAYQAILEGVDQKANAAMDSGRRDEARSLWQVVIGATAPWAPPKRFGLRARRKGRQRHAKAMDKDLPSLGLAAPSRSRPVSKPRMRED